MAGGRRLSLPLVLAGVACAALPRTAAAKRYSVATPEGRSIYSPDEEFEQVRDHTRRNFVVEVATGLAPQGNLALLLGIINQPLRGLELYAGVGSEANPVRSFSVDARYLFNIAGYRPLVAVGYSYRELLAIDAFSHNLFVEVGYKFVLQPTYHLTFAAGLRRGVSIQVREASPLRASDTDPTLLADATNSALIFAPTLSVKFSRAF